jgi:hypothetical protein
VKEKEMLLSANDTRKSAIRDVAYIPNLSVHLLSVSKLSERGHTIIFSPDGSYIYRNASVKIKAGVYSLNCETYSYCANTAVTKGSDKLNCNVKATVDKAMTANTEREQMLGHRRFAHLSHQNMLKLRNMSYMNYSDHHSDSENENNKGETNNQMQERRYPKRERKRREFPNMILYKAVQTGDDEHGEAADFNEAMKAVEERHFKDLQRAREMHAATEKLHRKRSFGSKTQRIEKQAECEEIEYQAQRHRFLAEIRREKERLPEEETRMNRELEKTIQNASRENAKVIERLKQEYQETVEECVNKRQNEIS